MNMLISSHKNIFIRNAFHSGVGIFFQFQYVSHTGEIWGMNREHHGSNEWILILWLPNIMDVF